MGDPRLNDTQRIAFRVAVATTLIDNGIRGKDKIDAEVDKALEIYETVHDSESERRIEEDPMEMVREGFMRIMKEFVR